jgi:hypothetical protein
MTQQRNQRESGVPTELNDEGEYTPAGEDQGVNTTFTAEQVASAFEVEIQRVHNAFEGEYGLGSDGRVDSRQAQSLAEAILGDKPQDVQQAALMKLGAYTPRTDHDWGFGEKADDEESDRLKRTADEGDEERG